MLGKNNFNERLRKMEMQSKRDRFSIRKLTVGAASVLLGFSFLTMSSQTAKADTISANSTENTTQQVNKTAATDEKAATSATAKATAQPKKAQNTKQNLTTYSGLSSFLKSGTNAAETDTNKSATAAKTTSATEQKAPAPVDQADNATNKQNLATTNQVQQPAAQDDETDVNNWADFTAALLNEDVTTINLTSDITATENNQQYSIQGSKVVNGNHKTLDIGANIIQDDIYQYGITFNDVKLMGRKPSDDPSRFNFYGYDNDKAVTLNNVESDNVSYDSLIKFENKVTLNYNIDGNIFSDYAEPTADDDSDVMINFAPTPDTSSSFICDVFLIGSNANVTANISNTKSALRGTGTVDDARIEVGEGSNFHLNIDPTVNFLYRVDEGIPPMYIQVDPGSTTIIQNNSSDTGVNPGKDNQIKLLADTPKLFEITSNNGNDVNNFNFPVTDISGDKMGMITDHYKWIIQSSNNANIIDPNLTDAQMTILANPTLPENILADGKADKTFQDLNTKEDFQTVIQSQGGFNSSAGFALGTDLYDGWKKTDAGRYNISSNKISIHQGQTSAIGGAEDKLKAVDGNNNTTTTIADLLGLDDSINPDNKTIMSVAWLPNQAMDSQGNLTSGGLIKDNAGNLVDDINQVVPEEGQLGNAVIRVTYGDGTTDDIPVTLNIIKAKSSGDVQQVAHGVMPTADQAKDAVAFDGDASNLTPTYEWRKADGSPLTAADLQAGINDVAVLVTYYKDGQPDGTQLVAAKVAMGDTEAHASGITAGTGPVVVHAANIPSANKPLVPDFTDASKWNSYLAGDLTNVASVDWDDDTDVSTIINGTIGEKTAKLRVTFNDGSTLEVDDVKVNVLGGEKDATKTTTTPNGVIPSVEQAKEALKDEANLTTDLSAAGYDVDYSWAKDDQGTPMDAGYVSYDEHQPNKTVPGYVVLTYYKKGAAHTPENVDGQQIVPVDVIINKQENNLYHTQLAGSGQNSQGVSVLKGTTLDDAAAKDAIHKPAGFPTDATFTWESPVDTSTTGDKQAWVDVKYQDGSIDRIPVLVNVYDTASIKYPKAKTQTADLNGTVPDAKASIANNADLPSDAQYEWANEPDLSKEGSAAGTVKITYADGSSDYVIVPVIVGDANPTQENDPQGQRTNIGYGSGKTATDAEAKAAISNAASLPTGTTFTWQTPPVVNDLGRLGVQGAVVKVTYPDGTSNNVPVVVDVVSDAHTAPRPRAKNVCVNVGDALPNAKDAVINSADLTNATDFEYETTPSTGAAGITQTKIKVTYADGSTDEVPTQIIVAAVATSTSTEAEKNNPHVKTVRTNVNSTVSAASVIDNFTELSGNPTAEWVDPDFAKNGTKTAGLKQSQVKLTFKDGSVKIVTGYVRVVSDGEKRADSVTGKTVTKTVGAAITAAEMVNALPSDATAEFASSVNIKDGKAENPGTYIETIHIRFHDGTEKDVASVLTVPRQTSEANITQSKDVVLHVVNVGTDHTQIPAEFADPSSFLTGTTDANIKQVEWAADGQPSVDQATDQITGKIKLTFNDGTVKTLDINVKVIGARKSAVPTAITVMNTSKLDEERAKDALNLDDVLAIDTKYPNAHYSWVGKADGTGTVDISQPGSPDAYVLIDYGDGKKQTVKVDLNVSEQPTSGATYHPAATSGSVTTHMTDNGVIMPPEFNDTTKMSDFMQIPGVDNLTDIVDYLTWANNAPTTVGNNQQVAVIVHYKDQSVSDPFNINVNVLSAKKAIAPTTVTAGSQLTAAQAKDALDQTENAAILAKYPTATFTWAANSDGTGTIDTSQAGTPAAYVVVDYGDGTKQVVQVDLTVKSQADANESKLDATQAVPITTHVADGLHNEVQVPEFTDPNWIKDNIALDGVTDSSTLIDHLSWNGTQPATVGDGQQIEVVAHYKDGSTSAPFKLNVNVLGARKKDNLPTTVRVNSTPGEAEAKNALNLDDVMKIDAQYPNAKYSLAENNDGTGVVDTSAPNESTAYVVIDFGDGTKQIVPINLKVDDSTNAENNHPTAADENATTPILTHLVHDSGTGNPVALSPDSFTDQDKMKTVIKGVDWTQVDYLTWAAVGPNKPGENQDVQVRVHYKDGSISDPVTVKANIVGVQHLDAAGITPVPAEVTIGEQPTEEQAKAVLGQDDSVNKILAQYPTAKFGWANKSDGTGTLDTSKLGSRDAYVVIDYGDGTKQVLKVPLIVNPKADTGGNGNTGTPTDNNSQTPIGGSVMIPQGTDLSNDTHYAELAISNAASLPAGTTYSWNKIPDTSKLGTDMSGSVLVKFADGRSVIVAVTVNISNRQAENVTLTHNAYVYNAQGQRINELILKIGSTLPVYGTKVINGRNFYLLENNYYLATGNVLPLKRKLTHNAYIYNKYGKRVGKQVLKVGKVMKTYGEPVKIRGKKFYQIGNGHYLKAANFPTSIKDLRPVQEIAADPSKKMVMHNSYLYDENGHRANQIVLQAGSRIGIDQTVYTKAGRRFYKTTKGFYIPVGNITGTPHVYLNHNAYVYNQYAERVGKKVLHQGQTNLTIYGDPIKMRGHWYWIIGNKRYLRASNINSELK